VAEDLVPIFHGFELVKVTNAFLEFINLRVFEFDDFVAPKTDEVCMFPFLECMHVLEVGILLSINNFCNKAAFDKKR